MTILNRNNAREQEILDNPFSLSFPSCTSLTSVRDGESSTTGLGDTPNALSTTTKSFPGGGGLNKGSLTAPGKGMEVSKEMTDSDVGELRTRRAMEVAEKRLHAYKLTPSILRLFET
ncbi:hypothetical protein E4T56_gene5772 [Termitomyces sp. T112]|nr:hypothetical protein E4T56_gene5772 [Termitomyces sp. T112]